jgi:hypothetical protein
MYMNFYFNTSMDSTYAKKYYTLVCFHPWKVKKCLDQPNVR